MPKNVTSGATVKKRYMIRCDIEGVSGVVSYEQAEPGKPDYLVAISFS